MTAGVDQVLVIGGGIDQPVGSLSGTAALLDTGVLERYGIKVIGLAGHPEGHRDLPPPALAATLEDKWTYAARTQASCRLVTQFLFDASPLLAWERALRAGGNDLPIHVGIPGPATIKTLLNYAKLCGVGNSMRVLARQGGSLLRLAGLSYPDRLLTGLAHHLAEDPDTRIERIHLYPFGGLGRASRWINAIREGRFDMNADGLGFTVDADPG
jgi:methylenetetrahydrofolate reductase (NADPH)